MLKGDEDSLKLPPEVETSIRHMLSEGEDVLYYALSDIEASGCYGNRWLFITNKRVITLTPGRELREIPLDRITSVEVHDYLGNGEVEVSTRDGREDLIRFSRSKVEEFRKAALLISELVEPSSLLKGRPHWDYLNSSRKEGRKSKSATLRWLVSYLKPHWYWAVAALLISLATTGLGLVPPYLIRLLIDQVFPSRDVGLLITLTLGLVGVYAINALLNIGLNYSLALLGQKVIYDMRSRVYEHLQRLSLGFYDRISSGRLLSRVMDDVGRVQWFLVWGTQTFISNLLALLGVGLIIFTLNWQLALFSLLPVPIIAVGLPLFRQKARGVYHKAWRKWADVSSLLVDTIPGAIVVKSFSQEKFEVKRLRERLAEVVEANMESTKLHLQFFPLLGFATSASVVFVWWIGGLQVFTGTLTTGTLVAFVSYMWMFYGPVQQLSNLVQPMQQAITSGERVEEVIEVEPDIEDAPDAIAFDIKGAIRFENVSFGYEPFIPVVRNINLEIKPGEVIGVVGPSGSGKTTLTKLLLRFYDPTEGRITIDGVDLRKIKLQCLREQIGLVLQDPILFNDTIAYNIAYGKREAKPEEIIASAKAAHAHDFIMNFPLAYDTVVGERGSRLSGGERQRIAIARALITDPRILILDEATSSVDSITEKHIQAALENLIRDRTTIIIAHRLSTLQRANRIIVIEKGHVVEVGSHEELLTKGGLYSQLYAIQSAQETISQTAIAVR
ncbi:MAG: ABC transporter transmembrane domain-containing protein [Candidatus Bathyarchaeia archaeon]